MPGKTDYKNPFSRELVRVPQRRVCRQANCAFEDDGPQGPARQTKLQRSSIAPKKGMTEMNDPNLTELRRLVGLHEKLVYEAVKAGKVAALPHESQLYAQAMQEHM